MTIKKTKQEYSNTTRVRLTHCPFCGYEFTPNAGQERIAHIRTCEAADEAREINP